MNNVSQYFNEVRVVLYTREDEHSYSIFEEALKELLPTHP